MTRRNFTLTAKPLLGLMLSACFALPLPVFAHAIMVKSQPVADATVAESPKQVDVWFNDKVGSEYKALAVINSAGKRVDNKDIEQETFDPSHLYTTVTNLPAGHLHGAIPGRFPGYSHCYGQIQIYNKKALIC